MDLEQISFVISKIILPVVVLLMTGVVMFVAYRKGLFRFEKNATNRGPVTINVERDFVGSVGGVSEAIEKLAIDAAKVDEYHNQSISQSRISFWFSLILATLGFLIISTSVFVYSDKAGYLGIVAGAIVDAVAALFFHQTNRARALGFTHLELLAL